MQSSARSVRSERLRGREHEQEVLGRLLDDDGPGGVLVVGAAGQGKSSVVTAFGATATASGTVVVTAAAVNRWSPPLGAFADLVELPDTGPDMPADVLLSIKSAAIAALDDLTDGNVPLLIVDDANRLDNESAMLVAELVATRRARAVLTSRAATALPAVITELTSDNLVVEVELRGLDRKNVAAMIADRFGPSIGGTLVDQICDLTGGVPRLVDEACRAIQGKTASDNGSLASTQIGSAESAGDHRFPVTDRMVTVLQEETNTLSDSARMALELIAICEPAGTRLVQTLLDPDDLVELERSGLVTVASDTSDRDHDRRSTVRLTTPLFGEVLKQRVPVTLANAHRERFADAIETTGARRFEDRVTVAAMRLDARGTLDHTILGTASRHATLGYNHALGERLARAAVAEGGGIAAGYALAFSLNMQNRFEDAQETMATWWDETLGATKPGVALAMVFQRTMGLHRALGRYEEAERCLDQAETARDDTDWQQQVQGLRAYLVGLVDVERGAELAQDLVEDESAHGMARLYAVQAAAAHLATHGRTDDALDLIEPYLSSSATLTREFPRAPGFAFRLRSLVQRYAGDVRGELAQSQRAIDRPPKSLDHQARGAEYLWHGANCFDTGDMQTAVAAIETGLEHLDRCDPAIMRSKAYPLLASARAQIGDTLGANDALELARHYLPTQSCNQLFRAELARAQAWVAAVEGDLERAAEHALDGAIDTALPAEQAELALTAYRLGASIDAVSPLVEQATAEAQSPRLQAIRSHITGVAADRNGTALEEAAQSYETLGFMLLASETLVEASSAHGPNPTAARRCSATAAGLLDRYCPNVITPTTLRLSTPALTRRERTIGLEAARGLSNAEIATQLGRSVRTVEWHLQQVYHKLGVSRRADLGRFFMP